MFVTQANAIMVVMVPAAVVAVVAAVVVVVLIIVPVPVLVVIVLPPSLLRTNLTTFTYYPTSFNIFSINQFESLFHSIAAER